jgi:hypothetical protein
MSHENVLRHIQALNKQPQTKERNAYLNQLLNRQNSLMGVIISKPTGKCIGTIENTGKIRHVSNKEAKSPYNIVMKPDSPNSTNSPNSPNSTNIVVEPTGLNIENMLMKNDLQGLTAKEILVRVTNMHNVKVLGQTVDITGKIVGLIIRIDMSNNYIQTKKTDPLPNIPILAILHKAKNNLTDEQAKQAKEAKEAKEAKDAKEVKQGEKGKEAKPGKPTVKPMLHGTPVIPASNKTKSKLAPNGDDENCVEPHECNKAPTTDPATPVVAGTSAGKPTALSGVTAKISNLWQKVPSL